MGIFIQVLLPLALAFIMFALGLGLTENDFLRVIKQPRDFFVGAFSQIILLPIIAFILIKLWPWPIAPELAIGVMIIAAAPGGVTSNILTSFAKGDVALSVTFTAIISLLCVFTVPNIVIRSVEYLSDENLVQNISVKSTAIKMFMIVTVPIVVGMILKKFTPVLALKFEPMAKRVSTGLFVLVLLGTIVKNKENIVPYFAQTGLITLALNVVMMIVAFYLAQLFGSGSKQKRCITIECGLQNGTLALFVANEILDGGLYEMPAATYSLIMFATSLIFVYLVRKTI